MPEHKRQRNQTIHSHWMPAFLIVDDELAHRNVLALMLGESRIVCKAVSSGVEALDLLQREPMDAIIADLGTCPPEFPA